MTEKDKDIKALLSFIRQVKYLELDLTNTISNLSKISDNQVDSAVKFCEIIRKKIDETWFFIFKTEEIITEKYYKK